jgi:hypothetical protein
VPINSFLINSFLPVYAAKPKLNIEFGPGIVNCRL